MDIKKLLLLLGLLLTSCSITHPQHGTAIDEMHETLQEGIQHDRAIAKPARPLPRAVREALLPPISSHESVEEVLPSERRFDVAADKVPAKEFFMGLVEGTPYNMMVNPKVQGTISLNLKKVTIEEAMAAVRDLYGYEYRKTSYGYEILPETLETQLFTVNYLNVQRSGKSRTEMTSGQVSNKIGTVNLGGSGNGSSGSSGPLGSLNSTSDTVSSSSVNTRSEADFWHDLQMSLKNIIGNKEGQSVVMNPQAGIVAVHAFPSELHQVARYLDRIQSSMQRQVILEAKILEVTLSDSFQSGVDWSLLGNPLNGQALLDQTGNGPIAGGAFAEGSFSGTNIKDFDGIFTINLQGSFRTLVRFLQTQGNVQVLSSPRISTVNNQKAVIKVGNDEFFVTGVSTSNTIVGNNTVPTQDVGLTPFFSGVTLDVTPQISKNGTVILHIHPSVSAVTEQEKSITLGSNQSSTPNTLTLPLAYSTIRESDNIVRAKNGQVVVIGGLMQNSREEDTAGTPVLSRIPFVGAAFRRTSQTAQKTELIILLRPILVDNRTWTSSLQRSDQAFQGMKRGFHAGGLPDVFGNEGEIDQGTESFK